MSILNKRNNLAVVSQDFIASNIIAVKISLHVSLIVLLNTLCGDVLAETSELDKAVNVLEKFLVKGKAALIADVVAGLIAVGLSATTMSVKPALIGLVGVGAHMQMCNWATSTYTLMI